MRTYKLFFSALLLCFSLTVAAAQADCPSLINTALELAAACKTTPRDQLCYGSPSLTVIPREDAAGLSFDQPGQLVNVSSVQTLQISSNDSAWGIALMNIQATLPITAPDQNVTLLPFGSLQIDNLGDAVQLEVSIAAPNPINVRGTPSAQGALVATLDPGSVLTANGRNTSGNWVHVQLDNGQQGWVASFLLAQDTDLTSLKVVDSDTASYAPMQAIVLHTGTRDSGCAEAHASGLLIQTPEGAGEVTLQINGVSIQPGATAFLQIAADNTLRINILEGTASVSAFDKTMLVPAGAVTSVSLDGQFSASAAPTRPVSYNPDDLQSLPLSLLPRQIAILEPLIQREINRLTACQITSATEGTNLREGPATAYFAHGTLLPNHPYPVSGKTVGRDGFVWWRTLYGDLWVRSDLVTLSGNCDDVRDVATRPASPSTSGYSTNLTCTSERIIYAKVGDTIPIVDTYASSVVPVTAINSAITVDGNIVFQGAGTASGGGITWTASWIATAGIHNVEIIYTPTIEVKPDWADAPFKPGEIWSRGVCQIRVE